MMKMYVHLEKIGGRFSRIHGTENVCAQRYMLLSSLSLYTHFALAEYPKLSKFMCVICFITLDCGIRC